MSGNQWPTVPTGSSGDEFRRWAAGVMAQLDSLRQAVDGPIQGYRWGRGTDGAPVIVAHTGESSSIGAPSAGSDLTELETAVDALEAQTLPTGWSWIAAGEELYVRHPNGKVWRMVRAVGNAIAPVVAFGDSNTTATSTVSPGLTRWPGRISQSITNLGFDGRGWVYAAPGYPTLLQDVQATSLVGTALLNGGINDLAQGVPVASIQAAIVQAVIYLLRRGVRVHVLTILPTTGGFAGLNPNRVILNNWIRSTWPEGSGARATYIDIAAQVASPAPDGALNVAYSLDGLHLNDPGQQVVAGHVQSITGIY